MSDHDSGYAINAEIGRLYLHDAAFQAKAFAEQQALVVELVEECSFDANVPEVLSNQCFSDEKGCRETRTIGAIFQMCSYCEEAKDDVEDYGSGFNTQSFCPDCAKENFGPEERERLRVTPPERLVE